MPLKLHNLSNSKKSKKRVGRGNASGRGTYSTRGMKGQRSRSGGKSGLKIKGFKQNLLRIPKMKGQKSLHPDNQVVKLSVLESKYKEGEQVNPGTLFEKNIISSLKKPVKILYDKDISVKFEVAGCLASGKAREAMEKAGGSFLDEVKEETKQEKTDKTK